MNRIGFLLAASMTLAACETPRGVTRTLDHDNQPTKRFTHCTAFACNVQWNLVFSQAQWDEIGAFFKDTRDADDERRRIEKAMSRFEQIAGAMDGTDKDKGGTGLIWRDTSPGQLDCYAEASNTGVALRMMYASGFLKFHKPGPQGMRGPLFSGTALLDHATATIIENADGHRFAVDSWFFDNGGPVFVVDFDTWQHSWHPEGGADN